MLNGFYFPPHNSEEETQSHLLCSVRVLSCYVKRTAALHKSERLFVHFRERSQGQPLSPQRLSHWLCETTMSILQFCWMPFSRWTRGSLYQRDSTSTALHRGVSGRDNCLAASWLSLTPSSAFTCMMPPCSP